MSFSLLLAAIIATMPVEPPSVPAFSGYDLGARDGTSFSARDRDLLPAAQDGANILDIWILPAIYLQYGSGGYSQLEEMRYTAYGRSWRSNHTYIDDIDVTDPFAEGQPMVTVPWGLWTDYQFSGVRNTYGGQLGVTYRLTQPRLPGFHGMVESSFINETGGVTLIPPNTLDGEPGTSRGAPEERRHLAKNFYVGGLTRYCTAKSCYWLALDWQDIDRTFITHNELDEGDRLRLATGFELDHGRNRFMGRFIYEAQNRTAFGGEYRLVFNDLAARNSDAFHGQFGWDRGGFRLRVGYTHKIEKTIPFGAEEQLDVAQWRADSFALPYYGESSRGLFQVSLDYRFGHHSWRNSYFLDGLDYLPQNRTRLYNYQGQNQWRETYSTAEHLYYHRHRLRTWYDYSRDFSKIDLKALVGLYVQGSVIQGENGFFNWISPYGQLDLKFKLSSSFFITLAGLTDVPDLPLGALLFANYRLPHSQRNFYLNGVEGAVVRQGGGDTHSLADDLRPAREWELFIGFGGTNGKRFSWRFNVIERFYTGRYMVMYENAQRDLFTAVGVKDPLGGSRGTESSLSGDGTQDLTAFIKDTALWGKDRYVMENDSKMALYQGIELQLMSAGKIGFFNLSGAAYWIEGFSPYGNGPAYNDFMAIDEESADPNWQLNQKGRLDGCHALGLNITWGIRLFGSRRYGSLFFASATRYRDGEPFSRLYVAENLPQGATPLMANWRAGVRYTYNMSCDLRLAYRLPLGITTLWVYADIYNLLDSTAELTEYAGTGGTFRLAEESMPPRTFMLKLKVVFN